jgi:toluene monooxygenase system protein A
MPKLERSQWYDLCRDMNWHFKYVTEAEVFPEVSFPVLDTAINSP